MNAVEILKSRPHWWVAFMAYGLVQANPATGGRILPLSSIEPLTPDGKHVGVMTPVFETKEDACRWIAVFKEAHPDVEDLYDKYGPVQMTPKQVHDALLSPHKLHDTFATEHVVPVSVVHQIIDEFMRRYAEGHRKDPVRGHADAQNFVMNNRHLPTDPKLV